MKLIKQIIFISLLTTYSFSDDLNIDKLLTDIKIKTDLSSKTKFENSGISTIYTRDDLDRMQVRSLKDILKLIHPYNYTENRFGIPDPLTYGALQPFNSSVFRMFIDNQEITTSLYGSGLFTLGDIDTDFVDHIEIYSLSPSYEFTSEATFIMIRLYSKKASKDSGSCIKLEATNLGGNKVSVHNSDELDKFSYFVYASGYQDIRTKYKSHDTDLSRDKNVMHLFASIYDKENHLIFDLLKQQKDAFINYSLDATPEESTLDINSLHIGYDKKTDAFSFSILYDYLETTSNFLDDVTPSAYAMSSIDSISDSEVLSTEFKYNFITEKNRLITGIKYKYKKFQYKKLTINYEDLARSGNTNQKIANVFVENQYSIEDNSILTTGVQVSTIRNNNSIQQDDLLMYRLGYTHTNEHLVFKTIVAHLETPLDPFLVNSYGFYITEGEKEPQESNSLSQNIVYADEINKYELTYGLMLAYHYLVPMENGLLDNQDSVVKQYGINIKWTHNYNEYDKFFINLESSLLENLNNLNDIKQYNIIIRNINTYKKFDIFNELCYYRDTYMSKNNNFDYSAGVKYHYKDNLTFAIKGENILNKAKKENYSRINPNTFEAEEPLLISPIDQVFIVSMEYLF